MLKLLRRTLFLLVVLVLAALYALSASAPEPQLWHEVELAEEYSRESADDVVSFADYLALEDRLFEEVQERVYQHTPRGADHRLERYSTGSAADPSGRKPNWNRSFELAVAEPRGAVLLIHGMSDSPYSLRAIGVGLQARGYHVLGLRMPGHGTLPSGLLRVQWQDMAAVTSLAMNHLAERMDGGAIHMIGYSTGAPLALDYALVAQQSSEKVEPASLVLVSPAIGISPAAALAQWNRRLSVLPGLEGLAWLHIVPEFDPFKYNSFTSNAAEQVRSLTRSVAARIAARDPAEAAPLPPILVLKSTVDATTSTSAVVDRLLARLTPGRHEYVLFDINRRAVNTSLLVNDPGRTTDLLLQDADLPFSLTVVANKNSQGAEVVARTKAPHSVNMIREVSLEKAWPPGILSLSHIALPFPPDDPLYGRENPGNPDEIFLGQIPLQGERGLLRLSSDWLLRLRHNPFYNYGFDRIAGWLSATTPTAAAD